MQRIRLLAATFFLAVFSIIACSMPIFAAEFSIRKTLAHAAISLILQDYYKHADHRQWNTQEVLDQFPSLPLPWKDRSLLFVEGTTNFKPAPSYIKALQDLGFKPWIFPLPTAHENLLAPWSKKAGDLIAYFIDHPREIRQNTVYVGHSSGGLVVYVLAAMAKGGNLAVIQKAFPSLQGRALEEIQKVAILLNQSQALFLSIASPFHGIKLTRVGELSSTLSDPEISLLIENITSAYLDRLYEAVGLGPDQVIDGMILGRKDKAHSLPGENLRSKLVTDFIQIIFNFFSYLIEKPEDSDESDGLIPLASASLSGPEEIILPLSHLALAEDPEAVISLLRLIEDLDVKMESF